MTKAEEGEGVAYQTYVLSYFESPELRQPAIYPFTCPTAWPSRVVIRIYMIDFCEWDQGRKGEEGE